MARATWAALLAGVVARRSLALRSAHNAETYGLLTSALLARHEFGEALRTARVAFDMDTTDAGMIATAAHDSVGARALLGRALALNPRFNPTQAAVARRAFDALGGLPERPAVAIAGPQGG